MARPRVANSAEKRSAFLGFQVTPLERAEIDRRAAATGYSVSEYCRIIMLSDRKAPAPPVRDPEAIRGLAVAIVREGTNLNQMQRLANERRALPTANALAEMLALVRASLEKVLAL
jgi:hypothetical protein